MKTLNRGLIAYGPVTSRATHETLPTQMYPMVNPRVASVTTKTADYTITVPELNGIFNNAGDDGTQVLTLPPVAEAKGKALKVHVLAAQIIRLDPQAGEAVNLHGSAVVSKYLNVAGVIGNYVDVYCDGIQWIVTGYAGVVTKEA